MSRIAAVAMSVLASAVLFTACASGMQDAPVPALREAPSADEGADEGADTGADETAELEAAAATLVGTTSLMLASTAFFSEPELSVERRPLRGLDGPADGRTRTPPVRLRLERDAEGCLLRRLDSGAFLRLAGVRCVPADRGN